MIKNVKRKDIVIADLMIEEIMIVDAMIKGIMIVTKKEIEKKKDTMKLEGAVEVMKEIEIGREAETETGFGKAAKILEILDVVVPLTEITVLQGQINQIRETTIVQYKHFSMV